MASVKKITLDKDGLAKASGLITVYNFNSENGLFICASEEQLTQGVGIPANSTSIAPPDAIPGKVNLFSGNRWQQVDDHRGETVYSTKTGEPVEIGQPGDYPADTTVLKPVTAFDAWNGEAWVTDTTALQASEVNAAEIEKSVRISEANRVTQAWQTQLLLGIITDSDKAQLTRWMQYIQALQSIEAVLAPDIDWPRVPL